MWAGAPLGTLLPVFTCCSTTERHMLQYKQNTFGPVSLSDTSYAATSRHLALRVFMTQVAASAVNLFLGVFWTEH